MQLHIIDDSDSLSLYMLIYNSWKMACANLRTNNTDTWQSTSWLATAPYSSAKEHWFFAGDDLPPMCDRIESTDFFR